MAFRTSPPARRARARPPHQAAPAALPAPRPSGAGWRWRRAWPGHAT